MQISLRGAMLAVARQPHVRALATAGPGRLLSARFVAGESLEDALRVTRRLRASGAMISLDFLGEAVTTFKEAERAAAVYSRTIAALSHQNLNASISIKPSHFGVDLDYDQCLRLIEGIATEAATLRATVRLDMESSAYTDVTLQIWRALKDQHPNVGIVLQAALRRTARDLAKTLAEGATIRLCKGAYAEPSPNAYPRKADVDANYERLMRELLEATATLAPHAFGNEPRAALATHDERLIAKARRIAHHYDLSADRYEFQMLYGVRRDLQQRLLTSGEPLRIYVPWGPAWYPYLTRRLAERPANVVFMGRAMLTELLAGLHDGHPK